MAIKLNLIPYDSTRLGFHVEQAERYSQSDRFWTRHFTSTGHACAAMDLSFLEFVRYHLQGLSFFVRNINEKGVERAFKDLGADMYALFQLSYFIPFQIYMIAVGIFFPKAAYSNINPCPIASAHTRIGESEGEIENLIDEEHSLLERLEEAEGEKASLLAELEERTHECAALNERLTNAEEEKEERSRNLQQAQVKIQELQKKHETKLTELNTLKETLRTRSPRSQPRVSPQEGGTPMRSSARPTPLPQSGLRNQVPVAQSTPKPSTVGISSSQLPRPDPDLFSPITPARPYSGSSFDSPLFARLRTSISGRVPPMSPEEVTKKFFSDIKPETDEFDELIGMCNSILKELDTSDEADISSSSPGSFSVDEEEYSINNVFSEVMGLAVQSPQVVKELETPLAPNSPAPSGRLEELSASIKKVLQDDPGLRKKLQESLCKRRQVIEDSFTEGDDDSYLNSLD